MLTVCAHMTINTIYVFPIVFFSLHRRFFLTCTFFRVPYGCFMCVLVARVRTCIWILKPNTCHFDLKLRYYFQLSNLLRYLNYCVYKDAPQVWKSSAYSVYFSHPVYYFHQPFILDFRVTCWNTSFKCIDILTFY